MTTIMSDKPTKEFIDKFNEYKHKLEEKKKLQDSLIELEKEIKKLEKTIYGITHKFKKIL